MFKTIHKHATRMYYMAKCRYYLSILTHCTGTEHVDTFNKWLKCMDKVSATW